MRYAPIQRTDIHRAALIASGDGAKPRQVCEAVETVVDMIAGLAHAATQAALSPETPPTMLPQVLGVALRAAMALEKVQREPVDPPSPPGDAAGSESDWPARAPGDEPRANWLSLPPTGHDELPSILPNMLPGPAWAPFRGKSPELLERLNRHMMARRVVWLRERAVEMAALLLDPDAIRQVEIDLLYVREGGDPRDIENRWRVEWDTDGDTYLGGKPSANA